MYQASFSDSSVNDWSQSRFDHLFTVYGHTSRIWKVVLMSDVFVSVGEVSKIITRACISLSQIVLCCDWLSSCHILLCPSRIFLLCCDWLFFAVFPFSVVIGSFLVCFTLLIKLTP